MTSIPIARCCRSAARTALLALVAMSVSHIAAAQSASAINWTRGTTLFGFGGAQSASSQLNGAAGVGFGWEVTRELALEGRATWFAVNHDTADFAATLAAHIPLTSARRFAPFVSAGAGMYRATFDATSEVVHKFYRLRMPEGGPGPVSRTFQDFLVTMGGGVNLFVSDHFALRPEVSVMLVTTRSDYRPVGVYGVQLVYHFEPHPVE